MRAARDVMTAMIYGGVPLEEAAQVLLLETGTGKRKPSSDPASKWEEMSMEYGPDGKPVRSNFRRTSKAGITSLVTAPYHALFGNLSGRMSKAIGKLDAGPAALLATGAVIAAGYAGHKLYKQATNPLLFQHEGSPESQELYAPQPHQIHGYPPSFPPVPYY